MFTIVYRKMVIPEEFIYSLAFLYPTLNYFWFKRITPERSILRESEGGTGIEIYKNVVKRDFPMFVNVGQIMIPIDTGDAEEEEKFITSKHTKYSNKEVIEGYRHIPDADDINGSLVNKKYINDSRTLNKFLKEYDIPVTKYPVQFPLTVKTFMYSKPFYMHPSGYIAHSKDRLIRYVRWQNRLPLSLTVPLIAGSVLLWKWYTYTTSPTFNDIPPFHYKRVK